MNNSKILVAIKCITYNHEPYIRECLEGFIMQKTNFKFVAIVHDDASTDGTANIIKEYAEKYPDIIKPIFEIENQYSKKDGSLQRIMNDAIEATGTKYVAMCEGDDYWIDPYKLQKQLDFMEINQHIGLCYTDYNRFIESSKKIEYSLFEKYKKYRPETYEQHLLKPGYLAPMTWFYRISLMEFIKKARVYSDGTYAYMLEFMYNSKVAYLPEVTAVYRSHKGSASAPVSVEKQSKYNIGILRTQMYYINKYPCESDYKDKILVSGYLKRLPIAVKARNEKFIQEAILFLNSMDIDIESIVCDLKQGEMRRLSYAYKLGKILLYPFSFLKKYIYAK